jgi:hypothetical protein
MSWSGKSELPFLKSWEFFQKGSFLSEGGGFCCCCSSVKKCLVRGENNWANGNTYTLATFVVSSFEKNYPKKQQNLHSNKALNHFNQMTIAFQTQTDRQNFFHPPKMHFQKVQQMILLPFTFLQPCKKIQSAKFWKMANPILMENHAHGVWRCTCLWNVPTNSKTQSLHAHKPLSCCLLPTLWYFSFAKRKRQPAHPTKLVNDL